MLRSITLFLCCMFAFASVQEDSALLQGADSLYHQDFASSFDEFIVLFEESKEPYYAKLAAQAAIGKGDLESALRLSELYVELSGDETDVVINKILADLYAKSNQLDKAVLVLERLYKLEPTSEIGEMLANIYMHQKKPQKAQKLYETLYAEQKSIELLKKLLVSLVFQSQEQKALGVLSEHLLSYGCKEEFCQEAISVYAELQGLPLAKDVFEKLYSKNPTIPSALNLMRVLIALKQYHEAQGIAQAFPFDKGLLLDLYVMQGDYAKARQEAHHIYQQTKAPKFLALEAIYEFDELEKPTLAQVESIAKRLQEAISLRDKERNSQRGSSQSGSKQSDTSAQAPTTQDGFFYNFYGYLLIDYELDIPKGIAYVKRALQVEPYAIAYIDSLAWGYYKLGDCPKALQIFSQIAKEHIAEDDELQAHSYQILGVCQTQKPTHQNAATQNSAHQKPVPKSSTPNAPSKSNTPSNSNLLRKNNKDE